MAYELIDLNYSSAPKDRCYFFDSNVLLPVLGLPPSREIIESYLNYFNAVYKNCLKNSEFKIYTNTNQLSEVFNILMNVEMKKNYTEEQKLAYPDPKKYFKEVFRRSEEYVKAFDLYRNEFLNYKDGFELADLDGQQDLEDFLDFNVRKLDFNDHVILKTVQKTKSILVSDDRDFYGMDVTQATFQKGIIKAYKDNFRPGI